MLILRPGFWFYRSASIHYLLMSAIIIGIAGAAHQAWSKNIFTTVGDMFPKS
jgi:ACS family hexuronate transporter-like MFS transporter